MKKLLYIVAGVMMPIVARAEGLVPCGGPGEPNCTFGHLVEMVDKIVQFALFNIAIPIAVVVVVIGGVTIMTSGGNESKIAKGKQMMTGTFVGLLIAFGAWLIVETVINVFFQ